MNGCRHVMRVVAGAVALFASSLALAGPVEVRAVSPSMWTDPVVLSRPDTDVQDAELAVNQRGDVVAVWTRIGAGPTVEFARLDAGSDHWTAPTILSPAGSSASAFPAVALEPDGDAVVVWEQWSATDRTVVARHFSRAGNTWSSIVALDAPQPVAMAAALPSVVVDATGNALASWISESMGTRAVKAARFVAGSPSWSSAVVVGTGVTARPSAVVDGAGDVTLAWHRIDSQDDVFEAVRFDAGTSSFGPVAELGRTGVTGIAFALTIRLGVDASGDVLAAFDHPVSGAVAVRIRRYDTAIDTWGAPLDLPGPGVSASGAEVAVLPNGDAIVVWRQYNSVFSHRSARYSAALQTWSTPIDVGTGEVADGRGRVVLDTNGRATVVWAEMRNGSLVTRTATSEPSGPWTEVETLAVRAGATYGQSQPRIAIDGAGRVTVAWRDLDGFAEALYSVSTAGAVGVPDFVPVSPVRVFDTRAGESPDAVRLVPKVKVGGGSVLEVKVTDLAGVVPASGVGAVSLNVTVTNPEGAGFVTVYPCGPRALVSSVNYGAGATVANAVIAPVSASGTVCFFSMVPTDLIVDLNGWFPAS